MIHTLKGGVLSLGLALKSKERMMSTARWGLRTTGYGELKVRPASTMYRCFTLVGCISNIPSKSSENGKPVWNKISETLIC